jgi:protein-disulfide isomerase
MREMMNRTLLCAALLAVAACQVEDKETKKKLDDLLTKADGIDKKLDKIKGGVPIAAGAQAPQPGRPDPEAVYSVPIDGDPVVGPANAKVTIVEAAEFACPFCQRVSSTIEELRKQYPNDVRVAWKHYVVHPQVATTAALATCAAQKQGKFFELQKKIWTEGWADGRLGDIGEGTMVKFAGDLGLNVDKFKSDMKSESCQQDVANDQKILSQVGVRGTPAFFINGRYLSGAQPIDRFKAIIDEEIKKADAAMKGGQKPEEYYGAIVAKGKKSL